MKKQYIVQKYVMADSASEALRKAKHMPVHEIYVHNAWWEKNQESSFFYKEPTKVGLHKK